MVLPIVEDGYLPDSEPHILAGASGAGKTSILAFILKHIMEERPLFGHKTHCPPFIGYMAGDRKLRSAINRFEAAGVDCARIKFYGAVDDKSDEADPAIDAIGTPKGFMGLFWRAITSWGSLEAVVPGSLLCVDGLVAMLGIDSSGRSQARDVTGPLLKCSRVFDRQQWTSILLHQAVKQRGDPMSRYSRVEDRSSGSMFFPGGTGAQLHISEPEGTEKDYRLLWKTHEAPTEVHSLRRDENGAFYQVVESITHDFEDAPEDAIYYTDMVKLVPDDGLKLFELITLMDVHYSPRKFLKGTISKWVKKAVAEGLLLRGPGGMLFKPKEES